MKNVNVVYVVILCLTIFGCKNEESIYSDDELKDSETLTSDSDDVEVNDYSEGNQLDNTNDSEKSSTNASYSKALESDGIDLIAPVSAEDENTAVADSNNDQSDLESASADDIIYQDDIDMTVTEEDIDESDNDVTIDNVRETDEDLSLSSAETSADKIINGDAVSYADTELLGVVRIRTTLASGVSFLCTGTLLTNQLVLTARHCVTVEGTMNGTMVDLNTASVQAGIQAASGAYSWEQVDGIIERTESYFNLQNILVRVTLSGRARDVVLLELNSPMEVDGETTKLYNAIYSSSNATLVGDSLSCYGYGRSTVAGNSGTLLTADLTVNSSDLVTISFLDNALGQIHNLGDSGGTCFTSDGYITGVASTIVYIDNDSDSDVTAGDTVISSNSVGPQSYRDWALAQILANVSVDYTFSPEINSSSLPASVITPRGSYTFNAVEDTTFSSRIAPRSNWITSSISVEPSNSFCGSETKITPMNGSVHIHGWCLSDGLIPVLM